MVNIKYININTFLQVQEDYRGKYSWIKTEKTSVVKKGQVQLHTARENTE